MCLDHRDHRPVCRVCFRLDAHHRSTLGEVQDVLEPGDRRQRRCQPPRPELWCLDRRGGDRRVGMVGDQSLLGGGAVQRQVVQADEDTVSCYVDRDLDAGRTPVERSLVGHQGVLGQHVTGTAVRDLVGLTPAGAPALDRHPCGLARGPAEARSPSATREQARRRHRRAGSKEAEEVAAGERRSAGHRLGFSSASSELTSRPWRPFSRWERAPTPGDRRRRARRAPGC